jgi:hypothetical protein
MGTNSWTKLYEILTHISGCISREAQKRGNVRALLLCEAPGSFVCALNHFVRTRRGDELGFEWLASTLNPNSPTNEGLWMICDDRFMMHTKPHWFFGEDDTGQLMDVNNIRSIWNRLGSRKVDIVTADGSLDSMHDPNEQENIAAPLIFCELACALGALLEGGTFVLKVFTLLEHHSISLMYILACHFEELAVIKPFSARHGNSELYVAALRFRGVDKQLLERLLEFVGHSLPLDKCVVALDAIPQNFVDEIVKTALFFAKHQEAAIVRNLELWHSSEKSDRAGMLDIRHRVAEQFLTECDIVALRPEQRLVRDEYVDGARQPGQPYGPHGSHWASRPRESFSSASERTPKRHRPDTPQSAPSHSPVASAKSAHGSPLMQIQPQTEASVSLPMSEHLPFSWARPEPSMREELQRITEEVVGKPFESFVEGILGIPLQHENLNEVSTKEFFVTWLPDSERPSYSWTSSHPHFCSSVIAVLHPSRRRVFFAA